MRVLPVLFIVAITASLACSSSTTDSPAPDAGLSCGLAFYPSDFDKSCQPALDKACCTNERSCASDSDCVALVHCIDSCPTPRTDACVNACTGPASSQPGFVALSAIADCTKTSAYVDPTGGKCAWPK